MPSPILARADALMQRRRQNAETDDVPVLTDAIDLELDLPAIDDDVPVLLDIEPIEPLFATPEPATPVQEVSEGEPPQVLHEAPPTPERPEAAAYCAPATSPVAAINEAMAHEIARRVEQRLVAELPRIIDAVLHEFLAEHAMENGQQHDIQG